MASDDFDAIDSNKASLKTYFGYLSSIIKSEKWFLATFFSLFSALSGMGQMNLILQLPTRDSGSVEILEFINEDSTQTFYTANFDCQELNIVLNIENSILENNPVYKYIVKTGGKSYESFFPGEMDTVTINIENHKVYHQTDNKFYNLTELTNNYDGDTLHKKAIIQELSRIYNEFSHSIYIHFILYSSIKNNLLSKKELDDNFNIENNTGAWLSVLRNYLILNESTITSFLDTLTKYTTLNEFVLLKFWGSWCKPCLEDDVRIKKYLQTSPNMPVIIGIQNDKKESKNEFPYYNILDKSKTIVSYYKINSYPTYILYKNGEIELNTSSLQNILDYFKI